MYPLGCSGVDWNGDWGWGAGFFLWSVSAILLLAVFVIPWFFFLLNLSNLLERVSDRNRAMPAGHVWLNFIPLFNLGWFIYTVVKVRDSVRDEYQARGWAPEGDFGYNVGITAGCLSIASLVIGWIPLVGWVVSVGTVVCWIIYWFKTSDLKNRLGAKDTWRGTAAQPPYSRPPAGQAQYPGQAPYPGQSPYPGQTPYPGQSPYPGPAPYAGPTATGPYAAPVTPPAAAAGAAAGAEESGAPAAQAPPAWPSSEDSGAVKSCAACGSPYDGSDRFCRSCGLPLPPG